jgi:hypothetical protein
MTNTLFHLLFLVSSSKPFKQPRGESNQNMPNDPKIIHSNPDQMRKALNKLTGSFGEIFKGENLEKINSLMETLVAGNSKIKIGHLITKLAEHAIDAIVHDGNESVTISHSNESIRNSEISIERTNVYIGRKHNNRIKTHLNGPTYEKFIKSVISTQRDCLQSNRRKQLYSKSGVNQRGFTFLEKDTFLTFKDIEQLANYKSHKSKITVQMQEILMKQKDPEIFQELSGSLKNLVTRADEKPENKYYSALLSTKSELKLMNRMPVYDLNVIIHLVKFRNFDSKVTTVKELVKDLKASTAESARNKRYLERIKTKDIKQEIEPDKSVEFDFSRQLVTSLNLSITKLESFKKNCILVNSWKRKLPTGGHWYFTINEKFKDGVYLNKFHELIEDKIDLDTPINSFLLIEYYGDNKASVFRKADKETISSVYSPCYIGYEMNVSLTHVADINKPDEILCYSKLKKTDEFEDENLAMDFYPTREEKFNVNFEDIIIGEEQTKKDAKFKLELNSSILENQTMSKFDAIIQRITKADPEAAESITPDDLSFMSNLGDLDDERGKKDNLRGSKPPYDEDQHH